MEEDSKISEYFSIYGKLRYQTQEVNIFLTKYEIIFEKEVHLLTSPSVPSLSDTPETPKTVDNGHHGPYREMKKGEYINYILLSAKSLYYEKRIKLHNREIKQSNDYLLELGILVVLPSGPLEIYKHQLILHHPNSDDIYIVFDDRHILLNREIETIECKMLVISNPFFGVEVDRTGMPGPVYYDEDYYIVNKYNFDKSYMRAYRFGDNQKNLAKKPIFLEDGSFDKT